MKTAMIILTLIAAGFGTACQRANSASHVEEHKTKPLKQQPRKPVQKNPTYDADNIEPPKAETAGADSSKNGWSEEGFVCADPRVPCRHPDRQFSGYELSFNLPDRMTLYKTYRSSDFYAAVLKTFPGGCAGSAFEAKIENERLSFQRRFPSRKVFSETACAGAGAVGYEFEGKRERSGEIVLVQNLIAVYVGATETEARVNFAAIRQHYPEASLKKMSAGFQWLER